MIGSGRCDHFRREPYPWEQGGRGRARKARRQPARSRLPANMVEITGSNGDARATTRARESVACSLARRRPFRKSVGASPSGHTGPYPAVRWIKRQ